MKKCPSVKRVNCDQQKKLRAKLYCIPYTRSIHLVYNTKNGWWETTLVLVHEILGRTYPVASETPIFSLYPLVAPQP